MERKRFGAVSMRLMEPARRDKSSFSDIFCLLLQAYKGSLSSSKFISNRVIFSVATELAASSIFQKLTGHFSLFDNAAVW